jgi:hypothetical protein
VFVLPALILALAVEVFAFIEVGHAIGWLLAVVLLLGTSLIGTQILRIQGRAAIAGVSPPGLPRSTACWDSSAASCWLFPDSSPTHSERCSCSDPHAPLLAAGHHTITPVG